MNKEYVLGLLRTTLNNYVVGCLAGYFVTHTEPNNLIETLEMRNQKAPEFAVMLDLKPMREMLNNSEKRSILLSEQMKSILRSFVKDMFEIVKLYANETNQFNKVKKANWYSFVRVIRNCLAHDFRLRFNDYDKKTLPVKWQDKEITLTMKDQPLKVQILNEAIALELFKEIFTFVETELR
ncbi:MAG: hypothetical protein GPJ51_11170 [Candidatus Heimdallarchaeota archaeon]|nr:hypothetical protein [Candidatus Heimdallarchaeota archaeon]